jgi:hypothetical protein
MPRGASGVKLTVELMVCAEVERRNERRNHDACRQEDRSPDDLGFPRYGRHGHQESPAVLAGKRGIVNLFGAEAARSHDELSGPTDG